MYSNEIDDLKKNDNIINGNIDKQEKEIREKFPNKAFKGRFPIRVLKNNLMEKFHALSGYALNTLIETTGSKLLNKKMEYLLNEGHFVTPRVKIYKRGKPYQISIGESFIAYTWCITYFFLIKYEHLVELGSKGNKGIITDNMIDRSFKLFKWANKLKSNVHIKWPLDLPSPIPTARLIDTEPYFCCKTNDLALRVVCFCLYHELGHVYYRHTGKVSKEYEQEADNYAFDCMLNNIEECNKKVNELAVIMGTGELLFLCNGLSDVHSNTHPDVHTRMDNALERIKDCNYGTYDNDICVMQVIMYDLFCRINGIQIDSKTQYKSLKECIQYYESLLDSV